MAHPPDQALRPTARAEVRQLEGLDELLRLYGDDAFVRAHANQSQTHSTWAHDGACGWMTPHESGNGRMWLTTWGPAESAARLMEGVYREVGRRLVAVTLPRDADHHLPPGFVLRPRNDWEWFVTWTDPPLQEREGEVCWLPGVSDDELTDFLRQWSPRHDVEPRQEGVVRWCGARGAKDELVAVAAHVEHVPDVPYLASIATAGHVRGQGYGGAVTAWITRELLREGRGWVTLGMYSDNDVARRVYHRLGYRCDHHFTSGGLHVRGGTSP